MHYPKVFFRHIIPKQHLQLLGFILEREKARFRGLLFFDVIVALIYSGCSIYLIAKQKADLIVLGLNILCLLRATINNAIKSSEITNKYKTADIAQKVKNFSYYHIKTAVLASFFVSDVIVWVVLSSEPNNITELIKILTYIAIGLVWLNDWENASVYAYSADIKL